ncbi:type II toxin-antitoxin system HipA family toxin [Maridesulfovibrio ferrireducens]|uniref:type II toxin-antitoxin system HipA family toxin n=1 Tax=Maridesulfovibrio ferrireducens TaxID=246191 RepID=UPI001A193203|nr:type II toxin-antitoxin system HipA family toxin [Maridesulfovibrio ferrireducens]MBI9113341.1 type II toxin-antitoxin system HipA family toxin [Maridesulfovibrio ferrireducens]
MQLFIYDAENLVGTLTCPSTVANWSFTYSNEWLDSVKKYALSCSIPLQTEPFPHDIVHNYFSNLLPESSIRTVIAQRLGVSEGNSRALLESLGGECAGRISLYTEKQMMTVSQHPTYKQLTPEEFVELINELPNRPFLVEQEGVRLSLAGAQQKLPIYYDGKNIAIPQGNSPSTHIVKPPMSDYPDTVSNELFCMLLAKNMKFNVPEVLPLPFANSFLFCIVRYDRVPQKKGILQRLHQEDFCQALGLSPHQKYEADGGVTTKQCFQLLQTHSSHPAKNRLALLRMAIFNYCIGNMDAHGKNFSLLYTNATPELAPFYDLLSTVIYENTSKRLAMKIGKENRPDWVQARHWERFAHEIGIPFKTVKKHCLQIAKSLPQTAKQTRLEIQNKWGVIYREQECIIKIIEHINMRAAMLTGRLTD